jgi:CHAD domain-containing protein
MRADTAGATSLSPMAVALKRSLRRALRKTKQARRGLESDPIHDVRVALRRCRSLAEGFANLDPRPVWRKLLKTCKKQQDGLADFRDLQAMREWFRRLHLASDPIGPALAATLKQEELAAREKAKASLDSFPNKRWKRWLNRLPARSQHIPVNEPRLAEIALERLARVRRLDQQWRRQRTMKAWHRLRIALKRFRYVVESFLPQQHAVWKDDLGKIQDLLGEGHDLDVLRAKILEVAYKEHMPKKPLQADLRQIDREIAERVRGFEKMVPAEEPERGQRGERTRNVLRVPPQTPWNRWRLELKKTVGLTDRDAGEHAPSSASPERPASARTRRSPDAPRRTSSAL